MLGTADARVPAEPARGPEPVDESVVAAPVVDMAWWLFGDPAECRPSGVGGASCQAGTLAHGELDDATEGRTHDASTICWAAGTRAGRRITLGQ